MKSWLSLLAALLAPVALFAAPDKSPPAQKPADPKAKKADASGESKSAADADKENAILASIPADQIYHGVHIPSFSPQGKLLMLFDAQSAKRINERNIEMQDLKMEIHNKDGSTFHVEMRHSVFNLDTRILASDTPTTIRRDDFIINGDKAEFHTKEKFGRVFGNVKMIIFNTGSTK
ncbi:MAG: hypothetical protein PHC88_13230 [Terrimicrobiaceae bacterium]|nr:hypothetical protein [Terrimicrobiaceae bacterium]